MKTRLIGILLATGMSFAQVPGAAAADYKIDPGHTFVQFKIAHLGVSWMVGTFEKVSGEFSYDAKGAPGSYQISVEIETASIDSNHAERDKHLRGSDFLDVEKYPKSTFVSTRYEGDGNAGVLHGNLSLHGVTKPIAIAVEKVGEGPDPWGGYRVGFEGTVTLKRSDFGMGYNLGPASESLNMTLMIEGIRK